MRRNDYRGGAYYPEPYYPDYRNDLSTYGKSDLNKTVLLVVGLVLFFLWLKKGAGDLFKKASDKNMVGEGSDADRWAVSIYNGYGYTGVNKPAVFAVAREIAGTPDPKKSWEELVSVFKQRYDTSIIEYLRKSYLWGEYLDNGEFQDFIAIIEKKKIYYGRDSDGVIRIVDSAAGDESITNSTITSTKWVNVKAYANTSGATLRTRPIPGNEDNRNQYVAKKIGQSQYAGTMTGRVYRAIAPGREKSGSWDASLYQAEVDLEGKKYWIYFKELAKLPGGSSGGGTSQPLPYVINTPAPGGTGYKDLWTLPRLVTANSVDSTINLRSQPGYGKNFVVKSYKPGDAMGYTTGKVFYDGTGTGKIHVQIKNPNGVTGWAIAKYISIQGNPALSGTESALKAVKNTIAGYQDADGNYHEVVVPAGYYLGSYLGEKNGKTWFLDVDGKAGYAEIQNVKRA